MTSLVLQFFEEQLSEDEQEIDDDEDDLLAVMLTDKEMKKKKYGCSRPGKQLIHRRRQEAQRHLILDYFAPNLVYPLDTLGVRIGCVEICFSVLPMPSLSMTCTLCKRGIALDYLPIVLIRR